MFSISYLCRDIDVIEWHEFLTPQLKLSQLFKAKPEGDVSKRLLLLFNLTSGNVESDNLVRHY